METREKRAIDSSAGVARDGLDLVVRADRRLGFVDLTDGLEDVVEAAGVWEGACLVFSRHTTCALLINEWEDGALEDLTRYLERLFPTDEYYAHDDLARRTQNLTPAERRNGPAHIAAMFLGGASVTIPVRRGRLHLGRWQRVILAELDEPRDRSIAVQFTPSAVAAPPLRRAEPAPFQAS